MSNGIPCIKCGTICHWSMGEDEIGFFSKWNCPNCGELSLRDTVLGGTPSEGQTKIELWEDGGLCAHYPNDPARCGYTDVLLAKTVEMVKSAMVCASEAIRKSEILVPDEEDENEASDE